MGLRSRRGVRMAPVCVLVNQTTGVTLYQGSIHKKYFCLAFRKRSNRCRIPAERMGKQPYCFGVGEGQLFAFAGQPRMLSPYRSTIACQSFLSETTTISG